MNNPLHTPLTHGLMCCGSALHEWERPVPQSGWICAIGTREKTLQVGTAFSEIRFESNGTDSSIMACSLLSKERGTELLTKMENSLKEEEGKYSKETEGWQRHWCYQSCCFEEKGKEDFVLA